MRIFSGQYNGPTDFLTHFGLQPHGPVQKLIDMEVVRMCKDYCPNKTGTLADSPNSVTDFGSGVVVYPGPYAHYQYYGEVYGPNIPIFEDDSGVPTTFRSIPHSTKHPTGRKLQYKTDKSALAGSFWFERMKADHAKDILEEARAMALEVANGGGK